MTDDAPTMYMPYLGTIKLGTRKIHYGLGMPFYLDVHYMVTVIVLHVPWRLCLRYNWRMNKEVMYSLGFMTVVLEVIVLYPVVISHSFNYPLFLILL